MEPAFDARGASFQIRLKQFACIVCRYSVDETERRVWLVNAHEQTHPFLAEIHRNRVVAQNRKLEALRLEARHLVGNDVLALDGHDRELDANMARQLRCPKPIGQYDIVGSHYAFG